MTSLVSNLCFISLQLNKANIKRSRTQMSSSSLILIHLNTFSDFFCCSNWFRNLLIFCVKLFIFLPATTPHGTGIVYSSHSLESIVPSVISYLMIYVIFFVKNLVFFLLIFFYFAKLLFKLVSGCIALNAMVNLEFWLSTFEEWWGIIILINWHLAVTHVQGIDWKSNYSSFDF